MNKEKTNSVWIGKENEIPKEHLIFGNIINEIKMLGVIFTRNIKRKEELNYKEILSKIKRLLGWWKERDLTLMGKVHLLKTLYGSLCNGKDRVKRNIMFQTYADGGIKMSNFTLFIKAQRIIWLKRLIYGEDKISWKLYFDYCCRSVGEDLYFYVTVTFQKLILKFPPSILK